MNTEQLLYWTHLCTIPQTSCTAAGAKSNTVGYLHCWKKPILKTLSLLMAPAIQPCLGGAQQVYIHDLVTPS